MKNDLNNQDIVHVVKGAGINFFGTLMGTGLRFLYLFFLAKILTQADLGLYSLGLTILKFLVVVSLIGLDMGVLRFVSLHRGENNLKKMRGTIAASLWFCIPLSCIVALGLFSLSNTIAEDILGKPKLTGVLQVFSLAIPFFSVTNIFLAAIQSFKFIQYKIYSRELGENILKYILTTLFLLCGLKLSGVVFAGTISIIFTSFLAYYFMRKVFPSYRNYSQKIYDFRSLLKYSFPNSISEISIKLIMWTDILMLGYFAKSEDLGVYYIVTGIAVMGVIFLESFVTVFNPTIADLYNRNQKIQLEELFKTVAKWIFTTSFPFYLLVIFYAKPILNIYGSEFMHGVFSLTVLSFSYIIYSLTGLSGYVLLMIGKSWMNMCNNVLICIVNIALNFFLIPKYGILGAALATGFSIVCVNLLRLTEIFYILKIHPFNLSLSKTFFAGLLSFGAVFFISNIMKTSNQYLNMLVGSFFFLLTYTISFISFGIDRDDKFILNQLRNKFIKIYSH